MFSYISIICHLLCIICYVLCTTYYPCTISHISYKMISDLSGSQRGGSAMWLDDQAPFDHFIFSHCTSDRFGIQGLGFRVQGSGFGGLGFRNAAAWGLGFRGLGFRDAAAGARFPLRGPGCYRFDVLSYDAQLPPGRRCSPGRASRQCQQAKSAIYDNTATC